MTEIPTDSPSSLGHVSIGVTACSRIFFGFALAGSSTMPLGHAFQFVSWAWLFKMHPHFGTELLGNAKNQLNYKHIC